MEPVGEWISLPRKSRKRWDFQLEASQRIGQNMGKPQDRFEVKESPIAVYLFHQDFQNSKGTLNMYRCAKEAGVPTYLIT